MSIHDPIDLNGRSQVFFTPIMANYHIFSIKKCCVSNLCDNDDCFLVDSFEDFVLPPVNTSGKHRIHQIIYIQFLKRKDSNNYYPFIVIVNPIYIDNNLSYIDFIYISLCQLSIEFFILPQDCFNYFDRNESKLSLSLSMNYLSNEKPSKLFSEKEWIVGWLLIFNFTAKQISNLTGISISYVEKLTKNVLEKTSTHNRNLYSKVAKLLGWENFIPVYFIKHTLIKFKTVYKTSPSNGLT
ncbi:helix-turn-helix transcriptional regulator [Providencia manganoxydans]|uniref:helix-turn-helix transcriptional regulator n=1 Tax=Providencia manganoxydans TaxID=2923283 RepID=UPI0034E38790